MNNMVTGGPAEDRSAYANLQCCDCGCVAKDDGICFSVTGFTVAVHATSLGWRVAEIKSGPGYPDEMYGAVVVFTCPDCSRKRKKMTQHQVGLSLFGGGQL